MKITEVQIFKAKKRGPVLAYANVILDNQFIIRGITLLEREEKRYLSMPARKLKNGEKHYRDMCHPLNSDVREEITEEVFTAYDKFVESEE